MTIKIILVRRAHGTLRKIEREFDDEYEAANWFINDSYFEQPFTELAVWERFEDEQP